MHATAADLVDRVLPSAPYRHWVLAFPMLLRYLLAREQALLRKLREIFVRSTTTVAANPNPSRPGQTATFTATVTGGATGTVAFTLGATASCSAPVVSGQASCNMASLPEGAWDDHRELQRRRHLWPLERSSMEPLRRLSPRRTYVWGGPGRAPAASA